MPHLRVAIDIGGTFTDICIMDEVTGEVRVVKTPSTPEDPLIGAMHGLSEAKINLKDVTLLSHGTTVATNALITRNLPPAAMICTRGFRDVIEIRRADKEELWDTYEDVAPPYINRKSRLVITERIDHAGNIVEPLDEDDAREIARILKKRGVQSVAICLMNSFINPRHEQQLKKILTSEMPDADIITSSDTLPEIFEHERFSTTVVNSILNPVVGRYVKRMNEQLKKAGYLSDLLLLHSGGGVMTPATTQRFAGRLAGSGIAAGAIASRHIAMLCGFENSIGLDMGGTSCDVSLVYNGQSRITKDWGIEFGHPIRFPSIEVLTIGAGGGSLAWIDDAGALHNGPQSAGASPGPACYGKGNLVPTNTDANVVLGRLGGSLAGGNIKLDLVAARNAVKSYAAEPLGMNIDEAAKSIISVANANMADAVRLISISRGYDPRDFALVAFGGAGALHGVALAKELSIPIVIVPPNPGVTSALGCLLVDIRHDLAQSYLMPAKKANANDIETKFIDMENEAINRLKTEGVKSVDMILERSIDMMYAGQWRSLNVAVSSPFISVDIAIESFHKAHNLEYAFRRDEANVDFFRLNLTAIGVTQKAELKKYTNSNHKLNAENTRFVIFDGCDNPIETPIYQHESLPAGTKFKGPAIIEQLDSTTLIPPEVNVEVDEWLNIRIFVTGESK
ncbi:hydantoinase [Candidatus Poribacteria bacterium]|nr:hydantoinase [Candidatus Poribacteria bacterium]|tara:strand:+ start:2995 stop:5037 length:2043 start_codon:yes stop_codon:yes gene_type:complete